MGMLPWVSESFAYRILANSPQIKPCKSADYFMFRFQLGGFFFMSKNIFMIKTLTDFRKTVETGVDPRLLTDLKPLFIPSAALALKCYECSEDPGSVGKCNGGNIGQIGNKTCVPLLNRCSTVRYTLKGTSLTALSCANSVGCDPSSQYSCKLKYQLFY